MWEIDGLKLFSSVSLLFSSADSVSYGRYWDDALNFEFSIVSIMLAYSDIISFPNKFKVDHAYIGINLLVLQQKTINTCLSETLISLKSSLR